jgi:hypothetical protein
MAVHLYFSLIPEALIASMLSPEQFGQHYATGHKFKSKGQSIFFEIDTSFRHPYFDIDTAISRCVPSADGKPKKSVYVSVYRVLEHIPVSAVGKLYLTTAYGNTIELPRSGALPEAISGFHLYHDLVPVNTLVVSRQAAAMYYQGITSTPAKFIRFPGMCFVELDLGALAKDPEHGAADNLPYSFIHHLRETLLSLPDDKESKLVHRVHSPEFPYRMVKGGFYMGNGPDLAFYPMPSHADLRRDHNAWWRSANL